MKRYILHSGFVISKNDGKAHFIPENELIRLYKIPIGTPIHFHNDISNFRVYNENDIHLHPDPAGEYKLPKEPKP
jgi:hypothetical protein